ncbi:MAG: cytochrome PufQ [Pseudomonadota bacterium]
MLDAALPKPRGGYRNPIRAERRTRAPVMARGRRANLGEYRLYFAILFLAALPLAVLICVIEACRSGRWPDRDPVKRALSQARIITPMIFSA